MLRHDDKEDDDPLGDEYEAHWAEVFRVYAYVCIGLGGAGVVLAILMLWSG